MDLSRRKKILILYSLFLLTVSFIPLAYFAIDPGWFLDKIAHFFLYIILMVITARAFQGMSFFMLRSFVYAVMVALLTESVQYVLPYRSFETGDILVNILGVTAGLAFKDRIIAVGKYG